MAKKSEEKRKRKRSFLKNLNFKLKVDKEYPAYLIDSSPLSEVLAEGSSHVCAMAIYRDCEHSPIERFSIIITDLKTDEDIYEKILINPKDDQIQILTQRAYDYLLAGRIEDSTYVNKEIHPLLTTDCKCGCEAYNIHRITREDFFNYKRKDLSIS